MFLCLSIVKRGGSCFPSVVQDPDCWADCLCPHAHPCILCILPHPGDSLQIYTIQYATTGQWPATVYKGGLKGYSTRLQNRVLMSLSAEPQLPSSGQTSCISEQQRKAITSLDCPGQQSCEACWLCSTFLAGSSIAIQCIQVVLPALLLV